MAQGEYRVRFRFHTSLYITDETDSPVLTLGRNKVSVRGIQEGDKLDTQRLVLSVGGMAAEDEARSYGERLKNAVIVASALRRFGVDTGEDRATTTYAQHMKDHVKAKTGVTIRDNVHGLDVYYADGKTSHPIVSAQGKVSLPAAKFFDPVVAAFEWVEQLPPHLIEAARLLNAADYAGAPVVMLALSAAAVEVMAPDTKWSAIAKAFIGGMKSAVAAEAALSETERDNITQTLGQLDIGPSTGVRVRELLKQLGMMERWQEFSKMYQVRGKLLHGTYVPRDEIQAAAGRARELARAVLIASIAQLGVDTVTVVGPTAPTRVS